MTNVLIKIQLPNMPKSTIQHKPDSKVHGANKGPTMVLLVPDGPHFGPMNLGIRECLFLQTFTTGSLGLTFQFTSGNIWVTGLGQENWCLHSKAQIWSIDETKLEALLGINFPGALVQCLSCKVMTFEWIHGWYITYQLTCYSATSASASGLESCLFGHIYAYGFTTFLLTLGNK